MTSAIRKLFRVLLVLWAGSLWSLSWVTWTLFNVQSDRHLAGSLVGPLFSVEAYLGVIVALLALLLAGRTRWVGLYAAAAALAVNEWALRPVLAAARVHGTVLGLGFGGWHGVSMLLYGLACVATLVSVWTQDVR